MSYRHLAAIVLALFLLPGNGCGKRDAMSVPRPMPNDSGPRQAQKESGRDAAVKFNITSTAFKNGEPIPKQHTGEGDDVWPPLAWSDPPKGAEEFALIVDDPDAPTPQPWIHWVIYGIPADVRSLPDGAKSNAPMLTNPVVARQGKNSWESGDTVGYRGPIPPPGHGTHHYHFKLFALDKKLDVPPGATKQQLLEAMKGHILAEAELVGTYERKR